MDDAYIGELKAVRERGGYLCVDVPDRAAYILEREEEEEEKEGEERRERRLLGRAPIFLEKLTQTNANGNFSLKNRTGTRGQKRSKERKTK